METSREEAVDSAADDIPPPSAASEFSDTRFTYSDRDVVLYALSIGVSVSQPSSLKYLYELHDDFVPFPTFALIPAMEVVTDAILTGHFNGLSVDPSRIVLGEQYLEIFFDGPLPSSGDLVSTGRVSEVLNKSPSGLAIATDVDTFDRETGRKLAFTQSVFFVREKNDLERWTSFRSRSSNKIHAIQRTPNRTPDASIEEQTGCDQSALYRIAGVRDTNPLHIDPSFARSAGYQSPILHGVCLLGMAVRHALLTFGENDPRRFRAVKVRFSSPVFPGDTLRIDMWKGITRDAEGNMELTRIHMEMTNINTARISLTSSYVDLVFPKTDC